jgi:putative Mn2+ efflux pump MntP
MLGAGLVKHLTRKAVAAGVAAGAALVATFCFGATVYFLLSLVLVPAAAAAITMLLFAVAGLVVVMVFLKREEEEDEYEEDDAAGIGQRAFMLFKERPILGTVAALAGGWIFLRNPALATMVAAAFTERSHTRGRTRR